MPSRKPARLGRPPASSSVETRARILEVAREAFAASGFGVTTNKYLATKAGITTGALYHYFDSKVAIYRAVYDEVQQFVYAHFTADLAGSTTFIERFEAMLESAHRLNREDPSLARFLGAVRIDLARHDELRAVMGSRSGQGGAFFAAMVDAGVRSGEIRPEHRAMVVAFIQIATVGLVDAVSDDPRQHRIAVDAIRALIEGRLFEPPQRPRVSASAGTAKASGTAKVRASGNSARSAPRSRR